MSQMPPSHNDRPVLSDERLARGLYAAAQTLGAQGRLEAQTKLLRQAADTHAAPDILHALHESAIQIHNADVAAQAREALIHHYRKIENATAISALEKTRLPTLSPGRTLPRVAGIMDEFTTACYRPECIFLPLHPDRARAQLAEFKPDLVFIESAWHGNEGVWNKKVSTVSEELRAVTDWCRETGTPSLFWNKEDPVHFGGFLETARLCDYVFTTDIDCVPAYKEALGHTRVHILPFAAQPAQHNPIATYDRKDAFNFAGSYYLRYPERQRDIAALIDTVRRFRPVEIYDRNHGGTHPHYMFPNAYKSMILGRLPFSQIDRAYKEYRYGINMNTIKQSQTMFARRVFELMASGTVVVSNFSRGVRTLFGDLVICSDAPEQLHHRIAKLTENDTVYRKFRLLGLRKVMQQHTYRARMDFIMSCIKGTTASSLAPRVALFARAETQRDVQALIRSFQSQTEVQVHGKVSLYILVSEIEAGSIDVPGVRTSSDAESLISEALDTHDAETFFGALHPKDHYGPAYLTDLLLARHYSDAAGFAKPCHYRVEENQIKLGGELLRYRPTQGSSLRAGVVKGMHMDADRLETLLMDPDRAARGLDLMGIDEFNYCRDGADHPDSAPAVADLDLPHQGIDLKTLYTAAADLSPGEIRTKPRLTPFPTLTAKAFHSGSMISPSSPLEKTFESGTAIFHFITEPGPEPHYVWMKKKFTREALGLVTQSVINFTFEHTTTDARLVVEFYDQENKKISHSMLRHGGSHTLAIPDTCVRLRFGLRLIGTGAVRLGDMSFGTDTTLPPVFIGPADTLVLTKQYPSYEDLYKYGFLHARVRGYRAAGKAVDIFRLNPGIEKTYDEFENIDVATGDTELLEATLASGRYKHVLVHMMDRRMWESLSKFLDRVKVTVWIHGAEIQAWQRRAYEFPRMTETEITRHKKLAAGRISLWQEVFSHSSTNLHFVFVSKTFLKEVHEDLGMGPPNGRYSVIHNPVDTDMFSYTEKHPELRGKVLSIRPYAGLKYGNDMTLDAILELSKRPVFSNLSFHLVGDGEMFEAHTDPLKTFDNVTLQKGFLTHAEIADLHSSHGVFLNPTRWDSQGVSRDEAMASGLVPVSNAISAVPEFMDDTCGILVAPENAGALADAIERLYNDPALFHRLSRAAADRVRVQSGHSRIIARELELIGRS